MDIAELGISAFSRFNFTLKSKFCRKFRNRQEQQKNYCEGAYKLNNLDNQLILNWQ